MLAPDGGYDPGEASHAVLPELRRTVERHPAVRRARGAPPGQFTRVRADIDPRVLGAEPEDGALVIRWYAGETPDARPEFSVHYSDASGFDCGFHHEPNPHVSGWAHYQQRASSDEEYAYEPVSFASEHPVRVLWEALDRLEERLGGG